MGLRDLESMKGLSICFSLALLMMAHFLAGYLKRVRATSSRSRQELVPVSNSLDEVRYRLVQKRVRARAMNPIPPALPLMPGQRPSGPEVFVDL
jgi:hypothetical protein